MTVSYDFQGKTAVVTGGSRGIGRAISELLAGSGADVWNWDKKLLDVPSTKSATVEITERETISKAIERLEDRPVDILVNAAGYLGPYRQFELTDLAEWQRIIQNNLVGTMEVTHQILPLMRRAASGRIVNMGSLAGKEGLPNLAIYSAASAGIVVFTKALSRELCDTNIRVNCVAPGPIDTRMIRDLGNSVVDEMIEASPLRRLGDPGEVASLVAWLCSDSSNFNTGAIFDMSGGRARY